MKRTRITLKQIAERKNLALALYKASKAKKHRREVAEYLQQVDNNLNTLATDILYKALPYGDYRSFIINDPKKRLIQAACFEDRVFHHALMNVTGDILEKAMSPSSYACRPNMGVHKAIESVQKQVRCYPWYCQIDIDGYFASIKHEILVEVLLTRFKGKEIKEQFTRVLQTYQDSDGVGLPIGSLTSQYFANYYLNGLDRLLENHHKVRSFVRYMDDIVWWCNDKESTKSVLGEVRVYLQKQRQLQIKQTWRIQRSTQGMSYCGFRVLPAIVRLSKRRKRRYQQRRLYWETLYDKGLISDMQLQTAYASVFSITQGTNSLAWRKQNLRKFPALVL